MKKVFVMAALVLMGATGSFAAEKAEANMTSPSEMTLLPSKKTTKKKTTTKKSSAKKTSTTKAATTATTSTAASTLNTGTTTTTAQQATSSSSSVLGGLLGNILGKVIGTDKLSQADLVATWRYSAPGCAFTSDNLLAKAGGEIASNKIESQLSTYYQKAGFSGSNTYFTFNSDGTFNAKIDGKSWNGKYTLDESTQAIQMKGLLLSLNGYVSRHSNGISLLFESKKLLTLVQTLTALSGNSTLSAIGNLSKNYDGVRIGFELTK